MEIELDAQIKIGEFVVCAKDLGYISVTDHLTEGYSVVEIPLYPEQYDNFLQGIQAKTIEVIEKSGKTTGFAVERWDSKPYTGLSSMVEYSPIVVSIEGEFLY